jgi:hypothetical protein
MTMDIKDKIKSYQGSMFETVDTLGIDDIKSEVVKVRLGNKVYDLVASETPETFDEDSIRKEFNKKIVDKIVNIKSSIKSKMDEVLSMVSSVQEEYRRKELMLKETMAKAVPMPDVNFSHAQKGLSVVKGRELGEVYWLVKRTYNPKFIDHKRIEPLYVKKLMTNIIVMIITKHDMVTSVTTRYMNSLEYFDHYHQARPDCWGSWKYPNTWKKVDDILQIADDAVAVMENINTMSIARRTPAAMPKLSTLRNHVAKEVVEQKPVKVSATGVREGLGAMAPAEDVWGN